MVKKLEEYENEKHRNRRKSQRRREDENEIARAAGWASWSEYRTAVRNHQVAIAQKE